MTSKKWIICAATAISIGMTALAADDKPANKPANKPAATQPTAGKKTTTPSGLTITVVEEAKNPAAMNGDFVWVHYTGKLSTGEQSDSSIGKKPICFTLGQGEVIKGWDEGVAGMKVGEKRNLVIPPDLAYAAAGRPPTIPANATLVFDVELIGLARPD